MRKPTTILLAAGAAACTNGTTIPAECDDFEPTAPPPEEVDFSDSGWFDYCDDWYQECVCSGDTGCMWICNG